MWACSLPGYVPVCCLRWFIFHVNHASTLDKDMFAGACATDAESPTSPWAFDRGASVHFWMLSDFGAWNKRKPYFGIPQSTMEIWMRHDACMVKYCADRGSILGWSLLVIFRECCLHWRTSHKATLLLKAIISEDCPSVVVCSFTDGRHKLACISMFS